MSDKEFLRDLSDNCLPCSDGKCKNIGGGRMLMVVYHIPPGMSHDQVEQLLHSKGVEVSRNNRCQPGKAWCVKLPE